MIGTAMAVILEYERRTSGRVARAVRQVCNIALTIWRRKPWPAEVLVLGWLGLCVATVLQAVNYWDSTYFTPPIFRHSWLAYLAAPVAGGFWGLGRQRKWREMMICLCIILVSGFASGTVQLSSCPHATYFQVAGLYTAVRGDPCRNPQNYNLRPWWMP